MENIRELIVGMAERAGEMALDVQSRLEAADVGTKARLDFVTRADLEVEAFLVSALRERFPQDGILGEEGESLLGSSGRTWVIDPIDGTHNFKRGTNLWGVSIGLVEPGRALVGVICAPALEVTVSASHGGGAWLNGASLPQKRRPDFAPDLALTGTATSLPTDCDRWLTDFVRDELQLGERRYGAATASLLAIIQGQGDLYIGIGDRVWDLVAGAAILDELGIAHSFDWSAPLHREMNIFACGRPELVKRAQSAIQSIWRVAPNEILTLSGLHRSTLAR